jgi:hypothetical protein
MVNFTFSPGTISVWMMAGVLSPVFLRVKGWQSDFHYPSWYPCRTPSRMASLRFLNEMNILPELGKNDRKPVSWQMGTFSSLAIREFSFNSFGLNRKILFSIARSWPE